MKSYKFDTIKENTELLKAIKAKFKDHKEDSNVDVDTILKELDEKKGVITKDATK